MKILIVGTGLMGCSFGLKLKAHGHEVGGWDNNPENLRKAWRLNHLNKKFDSLNAAIGWADAIIIAIPVSDIRRVLPLVLDRIRDDQVVIDFGSTKASICERVSGHANRNRFVAAHPIAGTEYSGPEAAFSTLYEGKTMVYCEEDRSGKDALLTFRSLCETHRMKLIHLTPDEHDRHLAYISHLSHVIAYSLSHVILDEEKDDKLVLELAGSGFASTVRLAKSDPEMWTPILLDNKKSLTESIEDFLNKVNFLKRLISENQQESLHEFLAEGRKIRKILK